MTDISSLATHAEIQLGALPALSSVSLPPPLHSAPPVGGVQEEDEEDYTIKCICGYFEDDGHTVYCEDCDTWQHVQCYYNDDKPPEVHKCVDCDPRPVDTKRSLPRQKQVNGERKVRRTPAKSHKKKTKDTPPATGQVNGWSLSDKDDLTYLAERHSGSPRDQPPPAKRAKTSHRSVHSISGSAGTARKRAGSSANFGRSPSKSPSGSPAVNGWPEEYYTREFMQLHRTDNVALTEANLHVNIDVTNNLSTWLTDPSALADATHGKAPQEVFQRWDKPMDDLTPPDIKDHVEEKKDITLYGTHPVWRYLSIETDVARDSYIGELKGHIGHIEDYVKEPANRWPTLRHPAPFVFFHPQLPIYIDTRVEGTRLRYARRSCQPNLAIKTLITDGTEYHFCLIATEDILAGSELTVGWELEDKVHQLLSAATLTSGQISNGFRLQGREEDYISRWVNNLLANFGDCACGFPPSCAMGRFDKRDYIPQIDGSGTEVSRVLKSKKHKRVGTQISPLDTGLATNSRSGSEAIKADQEENGDDSHSTSSRSKHGSRDNTPMTHFSGDAGAGFGPELSDREKKKLMQQEKLFEQMEHEQQLGTRKKKRNSGGSTLTTPSAATSVSIPSHRMSFLRSHYQQKQLGHSEPSPSSAGSSFPSGSRYIDVGIGDRDHGSLLHPTNHKRAAESSRSIQRGNQPSPMPATRTFADASTQTDPLPHERIHPVAPVTRKYIPRNRRLLRDLAERRRRMSGDLQAVSVEMPLIGSSLRNEVTPDAMEVDTPRENSQPTTMPPPSVQFPPLVASDQSTQPISEGVPENDTSAENQDVEMQDAGNATTAQTKSEPETVAHSPSATDPDEIQQLVPCLTQPPPPPWPSTLNAVSSNSPPLRNNFRSTDLHVTLPPTPQFTAPPAQMTSTPSSTFAPPSLLSPMSVPTLSSHSQTAPTFPNHSIAPGAVAPSPAKKKMSLSDYTKRSKAREVERSSPPVTIAESGKEDVKGFLGSVSALQGSAVMDTPTIEKEEPEPPKTPKVEEGSSADGP
ncbi:MAG: hypothetical protein M1821_007954 [Bathelium mastoideum]|nr:MAG: hypothetical protein M1821_007954 [Bathelium mastoideum]